MYHSKVIDAYILSIIRKFNNKINGGKHILIRNIFLYNMKAIFTDLKVLKIKSDKCFYFISQHENMQNIKFEFIILL